MSFRCLFPLLMVLIYITFSNASSDSTSPIHSLGRIGSSTTTEDQSHHHKHAKRAILNLKKRWDFWSSSDYFVAQPIIHLHYKTLKATGLQPARPVTFKNKADSNGVEFLVTKTLQDSLPFGS